MIREYKDLLLADLCGRLPYKVKVHAKYIDIDIEVERVGILSMIDNDSVVAFACDDTNCYNYVSIHEVKPYLFPLSSMTEEQKKELFYLSGIDIIDGKFYTNNEFTLEETLSGINWLLKNHFDINGLIPIGLAKDASGLNLY